MKREKDLAELHDIQTDLANYLYNNYRLYTVDKRKDEQLNSEYNKGKGTLTTEEFLKKSDELKEYSDIEKIEFTGYEISPMNTLEIKYKINDKIEKETSLDTISAETNKLLYRVGEHDGEGPFYLEKKENTTKLSTPENLIVYYEGGIK
ncbi:hypothetical protein ACWOC1_02820 [Enterococcus quebecensis]